MKKIMTAIVITAIIFMLTACEKVSGLETEVETPEQAITNIISAIKDVNVEELTKYGANDLIGNTDDLNTARNRKIFEKLEFNIISIEEAEDSVNAKVEFITKDLTTVPQDYADKSNELTIENNSLGENKLDDAAMKQKYSDLLIDVVDKCEYVEFKKVVDVNLIKENNNWKLNLDVKLQNAIYGNIILTQNAVTWAEANIEESTENKTYNESQDLVESNDNIIQRKIHVIR